MPRKLTLLLFLCLSALAWPATYTLVPDPVTAIARVTVKIPKPATGFHIPAWAPGDYELFNYGKNVEGAEFFRAGQPVEAQRSENLNNWTISGGADEVRYIVKPSRGNFSVNLRVTATETFVSGPAVFGWFDGHQQERQELHITHVPADAKVYSTLDVKEGQPGETVLVGPDYDQFLDAPLVMGNGVKTAEAIVRGKVHRVVGFNDLSENPDLEGFVKLGAAAAEQAYQMFGELPYPRYTFYLDFGGGGGGLEHLNGTRIGLGKRSTSARAAGLFFHEYFHTFNVKRIRSEALGPFDYTKPAITGTLWWLEGVTDYYSDILQTRAGLETREGLGKQMGGSVGNLGRTAARLQLSVDEASKRVWEVRGSGGFGGLNYYSKGYVLGLFLDLAIRGLSSGKHSLDDVMVALYKETKPPKPGYKENRIRELCIQFGGPELGPLYDMGALQAVEVPFEKVLPLVGMKFMDGALIDDTAASAEARAIGAKWPTPVR